MSEKFIPELVEQVSKDFDHHLAINKNSRILFSGRYGIGKTVFLEHYFAERKKEYYTIRLAPVNYSVSSNEDIFRYIKYDLLVKLLADKRISFEDYDFTKWEALPFFVQTEFGKIVQGIFRGLSKLGPSKKYGGDAIYKELEILGKEFEKYYDDFKDKGKKGFSAFSKQLEEEEGSIYEYNLITEFISKGLETKPELQNVLIIDDLDRIDPGHIFRLLNVFSAHMDYKEEGDKFGFDKIILVCDVNNLRNIFHCKYGADTDFNGYIDKFYSSKVFYFDNKNDLKRLLGNYGISRMQRRKQNLRLNSDIKWNVPSFFSRSKGSR
ncbi:MAG: hypothetical protein MI810_22585 [Flavobacteriales bacterium]|nr:hypothetical protein [Flavobacteriales bacterium]